MSKHTRNRLSFENLESRRLLTADWTNASIPLDVNGSGLVSSLDALIIINDLNSGGVRPLSTKGPEVTGAKVDVNADGILNAMDALIVINALNEFTMPMALDLNLQSIRSPQGGTTNSGKSVFGGETLSRSVVRLEEVVDGVFSLKTTITTESSGEFQFELDDNGGGSLYRLIATDVLGRSEQLEFRFGSDQSPGVSGGRLVLHYPVGVGEMAPAVKLRNQDGIEVDLADVLRDNVVVLYFYPKNNTPGCSAEAKDFRDRKDEIESLGAKVVGVSLDPVDSHKQFAEEYNLNFDILSDVQQKVSIAYGVLGESNGVPISKRTTFIIGQDGLIKEVFKDVNVQIHGEQVIEALRQGIASR